MLHVDYLEADQQQQQRRRAGADYPDFAKEAGQKALDNAGIPYSAIQQAVVGYVYGEM